MHNPSSNAAGCSVLSARKRQPSVVRPCSQAFARGPAGRAASVPRVVQFFLNSYHPLCETEQGRMVVAQYRIPPFVDYSIRREPDLQNPFPSITGLCRCDMLVGQAEEGIS